MTLSNDEILAAGGELGALVRSMDWANTPLGPVSEWPQSLRTTVDLLLSSRYPMFVFWGPQLIKIYNDAYRPITGAKHPAALGKPAREVWPEIWNDIGPLVENVISRGEATWSDDLMLFMQRNGYPEEVYFTFSYSPVKDESGRVGGVFCACTETTGKVIGERRLRVLRDLAAASIELRTVAEVVRTSASILESCKNEIPFSILHLDGLDANANANTNEKREHEELWPIRRVIETGRVVEVLEQRAVVLPVIDHADNRTVGAVVLGISPNRRFDDAYRSFFDLVASQLSASLTNANAVENERRRVDALLEADRAKTAFFSNVSHEFRTPLTLMLGPTEDLLSGRDGALSSGQRTHLEVVRRNALRLQRLVNALLDFAKLEAGRVQASYEGVELAQLTRDIASTFRSTIERAGLSFVVDCAPLTDLVYVDRNMWEQIVLNLLSNAFKFTFEGEISVSLKKVDQRVQLIVRDSGVGIAPEDVPHLFQRFHRVENTRARTHEGSGIGLALVRELVQLHGGTIRAESKRGSGTAFIIELPIGSAHLERDRISAAQPVEARAFVEEADRWLPAELAPATSAEPSWDQRPRILIADDNADMREYLSRALTGSFAITAVGDGRAALEVAKKDPPELILTDVMMPGLDGFALLRTLRGDEKTKKIPVVLLTARAGEESRVEALDAGADDYLVKPFSTRELIARLSAQIRAARAREELDEHWRDVMTVLENAPVGIALFDLQANRYALVNQEHIRLVGRDATGLSSEEAFPEISAVEHQRDRELRQRVFESGKVERVTRAPFSLADGTARAFSASMGPWIGRDGAPRGVISVIIEITEQVRARQELERSESELLRAVATRDAFLSLASHEFRTPLTTLGLQIDGFVRALQQPAVELSAPQLLLRAERLRVQTTRLERLVDSVLDVFSIPREKAIPSGEPIDLSQVAREVVARFQNDSKQAQASLELRVENVSGPWDRAAVEQILTHLLSNALKFGEGRRIDVIVEATPSAGRLVVRDRGIGIALENQERIFGRFERAVSADHYGGFGLGLAIARQLVERMSGTIRVESRLLEGSTFTVELPTTP